jgi:hypothetical protein
MGIDSSPFSYLNAMARLIYSLPRMAAGTANRGVQHAPTSVAHVVAAGSDVG